MNVEPGAQMMLRLSGPLCLVDRDGRDVTPQSPKAQAILALLGAATGLRRPRAWLQDKLWSDREAETGSANLRQAVLRLRREVDAGEGWLISTRAWIGLDPKRVSVDLDPAPGARGVAGEWPEFCEGLDIADPEFEDWIRDRRLAEEDRLSKAGPRMTPPPLAVSTIVPRPAEEVENPPVLLLSPGRANDAIMAALAEALGSEIVRGVASLGGAEVRMEGAGAVRALPKDGLRLRVSATRMGESVLMQAQLSDLAWGTLVWVENRVVDAMLAERSGPAFFDDFAAKSISATIAELGRGGQGKNGSLVRAKYRALGGVLSLDSERMLASEEMFIRCDGSASQALSAAWRAQLRVFSIIERLAPDPHTVGDEAIEIVARSLSEDPANPTINAIASEVALHVENRPEKALELAMAALDRGPYNPFAHSSLAQAQARLGRYEEAHLRSLQALRLSALMPNSGLWHIRACITALNCGMYDKAMRFAQVAHEIAPKFKPPLRFLAALQFHQGDEAGALGSLQKLRVLETDFTLDLMASEDYPIVSLRRTPLFAITRSTLL